VIDPVPSLGEALTMGGASQAAAQQSQQGSGVSNAALLLEDEATPLGVEAAQASSMSGGSTQPGIQVFAEREYVWGPGDGWGVAGIDELLAQFDRTGAVTFAITDAGGDMVALVNAGGPGGAARVAGQWTYDACGNVLSTDHIHAHAYSRVGHKGLIFDRLDAGVGPGTGIGVADRGDDGSFTAGQFVGHASCGFDTPRIVPFAKGLYHNRNRVYMPELGRFAQADPNASGMGLLDMPIYHGGAFSAGAVSFDVQARYGDGGSLYAYMGGNPWMNSDPMGLSWDPFDIVDDFVAESMGSSAALLERIVGSARATAYIAASIASYIPLPALSMAGSLALSMMEEPEFLANSATWQMTRSAMGVIDSLMLHRMLSRFAISSATTAFRYASSHGSRTFGLTSSGGLTSRAGKLVQSLREGVFTQLRSGPAAQVYLGIRNNRAVYVGITNDLSRRQSEHNRRNMRLRLITPRIPRTLAISNELAIKMSNPQFDNINMLD